MFEVHRRGGFSDRNRINPENTVMQVTDFDFRTRNMMISSISRINKIIFEKSTTSDYATYKKFFCEHVLSDIYAQKIDYTFPYDFRKVCDIIEATISDDNYDAVLTVIEALVQLWSPIDRYIYYELGSSIFEYFNKKFEKEYVGYRFVKDKITPITDTNEIEAINEAIHSEYKVVDEHLEKSLEKLSDRINPDYENSIKESICAVEAICEIITASKGKEATLGNMLKKLEESGVKIHGALKEAFTKLYGYTSDSKGIRHAGDIGGPNATFEEAKFMLVSCCAFINYLKAIQAKS